MTLLILGASARAAACSARRAGLRPESIDLFADRDLSAAGPARRIDRDSYPSGLERLAAESAEGPWIYTGALENEPDLIGRLAEARSLWGNGEETLRAVRDPAKVAEVLRHAGLPCPAVRMTPVGLARDGSWLEKPLASGGGEGICPLASGGTRFEGPVYYQERIAGPSYSGLFLGELGSARLVGVTRQRIGRPGAPFAYAGSLGPCSLAPDSVRTLEQIGGVLASAFGLKGLFGVDLILKDEVPWPVEINPRYTASVEVLEWATGRALLEEHSRVFGGNGSPLEAKNLEGAGGRGWWGSTPPYREPWPVGDRVDAPRGIGELRETDIREGHSGNTPGGHFVVGKAILFAERSGDLPEFEWAPPHLNDAVPPAIADVPRPGTRVEAGEPILTVFSRARTVAACEARVRESLGRWRTLLRGDS
jgi:uncharacterized protein